MLSVTNKFSEVSTSASLLRTMVFTAGHFFIDAVVIALVTGVPIETATLAALIAPAINGLWYFFIDRMWSNTHKLQETKVW
jgi:uncharacterized membrane protein